MSHIPPSKQHLVIGYGEVGKALVRVLSTEYQVHVIDLEAEDVFDPGPRGQVMHICFPWTEDFHKIVRDYMLEHKPHLVIVHSTVPVGTCDKLGVVHSPIRGIHPDLEGGIMNFVKYFGGRRARKASHIFQNLGIETHVKRHAKEIEALKLWSTTQYGMMIVLQKAIYKWCKQNKVDFETVYTHGNETYNEGYEKLRIYEVIRPILKNMKGPIGGHCIVSNLDLLGSNDITDLIKYINDKE